MTLQDAARALGLAPGEVAEVSESAHGMLARLTAGGTRLITPSDGVYACDDHPSGKHLRRWPGAAPAHGGLNGGQGGGQGDGQENSEADGTGGEPPAGGAVPAGTVEEVLGWVGADRERAAQALAAEQASARPRSTLVARLTELAGEQ